MRLLCFMGVGVDWIIESSGWRDFYFRFKSMEERFLMIRSNTIGGAFPWFTDRKEWVTSSRTWRKETHVFWRYLEET